MYKTTVRRTLKTHRLTQAQLAKLLSVRREQVNRWATGTTTPSRLHKEQLSYVAGMSRRAINRCLT